MISGAETPALRPDEPKLCPQCGHTVQGLRREGNDARRKSGHDPITPEIRARPRILEGRNRGPST